MRKNAGRDLAERLEVEAALSDAFAPLRARHAELSPLRVRAAVRWGRGAPQERLPWAAAAARLSELSVAVGMTVMVFIAAFSPVPVPALDPRVDEAKDPAVYPVPHVSAPADDALYIRWLRLDRYVPVQDWLDPSVVRVGAVRSVPRLDPPSPTGLNEPY